MKRKHESVTEAGFFKRPKTSENIGEKIIKAASLYDGKLQHISSNGYYVTAGLTSPFANDFILNFCDSIGEIPQQIKEEVARKFQVMKNSPTNTPVVARERSDENLHLCCWDFCFLVLNDVGIVTEQQIDDLCYIIYMKNKELDEEDNNQLTLADALLNPDSAYQAYASDNLPSPGDLLVFKKIEPVLINSSTANEEDQVSEEQKKPLYFCALATDTRKQIGRESRPYHCSIATDNPGEHIGLDPDEEYVTKKNLITKKTLKTECVFEDTEYSFEDDGMYLPDKVYYVPVAEVGQNIKNFIAKNQNILDRKDAIPKQSEEEILHALISGQTQYDKLAEELRDRSKLQPS